MPTLPDDIIAILAAFAPLFSARTFASVQVLVTGAILTPGGRTITNALRAMGLAKEKHFQNYHRVLNRAVWSSRRAAKVLLRLLVQTFAPTGPLVRFGVTMVTRLRLDAALYEPAPERKPGQTGRPRKKGKRLPALAHKLGDAATPWTALTIACWYGQNERQIEIVSQTAVWYHSGMEPVPLRWVLIRDPPREFRAAGLALH